MSVAALLLVTSVLTKHPARPLQSVLTNLQHHNCSRYICPHLDQCRVIIHRLNSNPSIPKIAGLVRMPGDPFPTNECTNPESQDRALDHQMLGSLPPVSAPPGIPPPPLQGTAPAATFAVAVSSYYPWQGPARPPYLVPQALPSHHPQAPHFPTNIPQGLSSNVPQASSSQAPHGVPSTVPRLQHPAPSDFQRAIASAGPRTARSQSRDPGPQLKDISRLQQEAQRDALMPRRVKEDGTHTAGPSIAEMRDAYDRQTSSPGRSTFLERPHFVIYECPNCHWRPEDGLPSSEGSRTGSSSSHARSPSGQGSGKKHTSQRETHVHGQGSSFTPFSLSEMGFAVDARLYRLAGRQRRDLVTGDMDVDDSPPWGPTHIEAHPPSQPVPSLRPLWPPSQDQSGVPDPRLASWLPTVERESGEHHQPHPSPPFDLPRVPYTQRPSLAHQAYSDVPQPQGKIWHPLPSFPPLVEGVPAHGLASIGTAPYGPNIPGFQTWPHLQEAQPPAASHHEQPEQTIPKISYSLSDDGPSRGSRTASDCSASPSPSPKSEISPDGNAEESGTGRIATGGRQLSKSLDDTRSRSMSPNRSGAISPCALPRKRSASFESSLARVAAPNPPHEDKVISDGATSSVYHSAKQDVDVDSVPSYPDVVPSVRARSALLEVPGEQEPEQDEAKALRHSV